MDFNFTQYYLTKNECYISGKRMTPAGIIVHSTGANNTSLKRFIGPDDGKLGKNKYNNHWNQMMDRRVCVHAFIGQLEDGTVACYQTLPWDMVGWHSGSGKKGSANNMGYIGFEICEDNLKDKAYFDKVYDMAAHLCAYLCQKYNIPIEKVICHSEAHALGIASNHGDVMHWFPKHGKSMNTFRADVKACMGHPNDPTDFVPGQYQTNTPNDTLNVRTDPSASAKKVGELADKSIVEVTGRAANGWLKIKRGTLEGWVNGKYLSPVKDEFVPYVVRVTADVLNIRKGPGVEHAVAGQIKNKGSFTIVEEKDGWGRLKSGAGWISLKYTEKR